MIIANGTIRFAAITPGGIDAATGHAIAAAAVWGNHVPCQWGYDRRDLTARDAQGNPVTSTRRWVLIEGDGEEAAERLRLYNTAGELLGEYSVVAIEHLAAVNQSRITI